MSSGRRTRDTKNGDERRATRKKEVNSEEEEIINQMKKIEQKDK